MRCKIVHTNGKHFYISLSELFFQESSPAKFGSAHRSIIGRVAKEYSPAVAQVFIKIDGPFGCLGLEIWGGIA
jgi:hypothetical protein